MRSIPGLAFTLLLTLATPAAFGQCTFDDAFEDNDSCGAAVPIPTNTSLSLVFHGPLAANGIDEDYFRVTVPAGETLEAAASAGFLENGIIELYGDAQCTQLEDSAFLGFAVRATNSTGAPRDYWLRIGPLAGDQVDCRAYDLFALTYVDICPTLSPDAFEPNNSFGNAAVLPLGLHQGLNVTETDDDWFLIPVPPGSRVDVDLQDVYSRAHNPNVRAAFVNVLTGEELFWTFSDETASLVNNTEEPFVGLHVRDLGAFDCNEYSLDVSVAALPCTGVPSDVFEPNDGCGVSAAAITPGFYSGLSVFEQDVDGYSFELPAEETRLVEITWDGASVQSDVIAFLRFVGCSGSIEPSILETGRYRSIVHNWTTIDHTSYLDVQLQLGVGSLNPDAPCATYDLRLEGTPIGTNYCTAVPNSTGEAGTIRALGSPLVADDRLALVADRLPPGSNGVFFYGTAQTQVPFGLGNLCITGDIERLNPPIFAPTFAERWIDFGEPPASTDLLPGTTMHFSFWHRENTGSFNFTDAVSLTFQ